MNAGILPIALLFLAAALSLSFASLRGAAAGAVATAGATAIGALIIAPQTVDPRAVDWIFAGLWLSAIAAIGSMYLWTRMPLPFAAAVGINCGAWAGALAATTSLRAPTMLAIPVLLLVVPGHWLVQRGGGIALKVIGGWVVAVAILAIFVSLTPTPGYKPDHLQ